VEEAFDHFHDAMEDGVMEGNAEDKDILNLGELVRWMQSFPAGGGAHKVLLGNGDLRQVPRRMRRAYMQMQMDAGLHNLWLQCCVSVIRAAWATHDAAVEDNWLQVIMRCPLWCLMVRKCLGWLAQRLACDSLSQMCGIWCHNSAQSGQTGAIRG